MAFESSPVFQSTSWSAELEVGYAEEVSIYTTLESDFDRGYRQALEALEADAARARAIEAECNAELLRQKLERRVRRAKHRQHKLNKLLKSVKRLVGDVRRKKEARLRAPSILLTPPQSNSSSEESPVATVESMPT